MTQREARRLALLIVADETDRSLDISAEWGLHPETNEELASFDALKVQKHGRRIVKKLFSSAAKLATPTGSPTGSGE